MAEKRHIIQILKMNFPLFLTRKVHKWIKMAV